MILNWLIFAYLSCQSCLQGNWKIHFHGGHLKCLCCLWYPLNFMFTKLKPRKIALLQLNVNKIRWKGISLNVLIIFKTGGKKVICDGPTCIIMNVFPFRCREVFGSAVTGSRHFQICFPRLRHIQWYQLRLVLFGYLSAGKRAAWIKWFFRFPVSD